MTQSPTIGRWAQTELLHYRCLSEERCYDNLWWERNCCYIWEFLVKYRKLIDRGLIGTAILFDKWNRILVSDPNVTLPLAERALYRLLSLQKTVVPIVLSSQLVDTLISPGIEPVTQRPLCHGGVRLNKFSIRLFYQLLLMCPYREAVNKTTIGLIL